MSRESALAKNTFVIALGTFLPRLTAFVTLPIVTGGLTKTEMGTYDLISTLVSLLLPVVTVQVQMAAFRFLIDARGDKARQQAIITNIFCFIVPVSVVSLAILYLCLGSISPLIRLLISLYFFMDILRSAAQQVVRGLGNNRLYSISAVVSSVTNMGLVALFVAGQQQGLAGVLLAAILSTTLALAVLVWRGRILPQVGLKNASWPVMKELLAYSWPLVPNGVSNWVLNFSDRTVLIAFIGLEANAVYGVANKIPSLVNMVNGTFAFAWQENASIAKTDEDSGAYYTRMFDQVFCLTVGVLGLLIAATPLLFRLLIRGDYSEAFPQMPILFMAALFASITTYMSGIYVAHKRTRSVGLTTLLAAGINLLIDLLFVRAIGIYAASVSTLVSYLFLAVYRMVDARRFQPMDFNWRKIIALVAVLTGMCVLCFLNRLPLHLLNAAIGLALAIGLNRPLLKGLWRMVTTRLKR